MKDIWIDDRRSSSLPITQPSAWCIHGGKVQRRGGGMFASIIGQDPDASNSIDGSSNPFVDLYFKLLQISSVGETSLEKKNTARFQVKIENPAIRRLISGGIAGAISRTVVAPLETIRTHLIVGSCGKSTVEVFRDIMKTDGWTGLFSGNFANVIRVAPSRAIELFSFDTMNDFLSSNPWGVDKLPLPPSLIAGACAGIGSTLFTYPLDLLKTRITVQRGVYNGLWDAFVKTVQEGGPAELFRGLTPSLIGVIPYASINYYAYDALRKMYRELMKQEKIGNMETLIMGSIAGAVSSTVSYPLEVARKHMQVGSLGGRRAYRDLFHALSCIVEEEGVEGLYRGLLPSCLKLVPAAGISFMCYEACKRVLIEKKGEDGE